MDPGVSALAVTVHSGQVPIGGGHRKRNKSKSKKQQGVPKLAGAEFLCARCLRAGHLASQCRLKFGTNAGLWQAQETGIRVSWACQFLQRGIVPRQK